MPEPPSQPPERKSRLIEVTLDERAFGRHNANVEHEREVAIFDLLDSNSFELEGRDDGPYKLVLSITEDRLVFNIGNETAVTVVTHLLSLTPLKRIIRDYFIICESYYEAIRTAPPSRIQAIDMGRRGLHDEGSRILMERLQGKITVDFDTARRLFTLICALHWKG